MAASPFIIKRFRILFICCWLVILTEHTLLLYFYDLPLKVAFVDSLISNSFFLLCSLLIITTLRYYLPRGRGYFNFLLLCIVLTIGAVLFSKLFLQLAQGDGGLYSQFLNRSFGIRASIGFLFLSCVALIAIIWRRQQDEEDLAGRKQDAEKLARDAELFQLRQQLQPHFLFNSLNSINALIGSQPKEARKMVQQLSEFLRGTIRKDETQWISLGEELQHLQLYLDIETIRFGNRLQTNIEKEDACNEMKLPALLLQPIVENAIKFGLYDTIGQTTITLKARVENNELIIMVQNPFDPETSSNNRGIGFGLRSIERRLYLLFARTNLLTSSAAGNIFTTVLKIPQTTHD
ncbi:MAG: GHKL domain-containing protein [Chitinophagaceae bacterium]|nr:MAG: GHKL domain-containing protein [Chitinophagaceae bacterium]